MPVTHIVVFEENFCITVLLTSHGASLEISGSKRNYNIIIIIIITDKTVPANRPDITFTNKKNKNHLFDRHSCPEYT
jgi:hypothetical protein